MDLGDLAIADALKQIVGLMDLQDLKEMVAIKELEEADARSRCRCSECAWARDGSHD